MSPTFFRQRQAVLNARLNRLAPSIERARLAVRRLELEPVPAGATSARAARLAAAHTMYNTLIERQRQLSIALVALAAENEL